MSRMVVGGRILSAILASIIGIGVWSLSAVAKTPGKTYCFLGVCHRVLSLAETGRLVGKTTVLMASHYDDAKKDRFNPSNITSSGAYFRAGSADNAASPIYPDGTVLLVWNAQTKKAAVVRVDNAGPYYKNRKLDVARGVAEKLGFARRGVARLHVTVVRAPSRSEARYRRGRVYAPVAGYIGTHVSMQVAMAAAQVRGGGSVGGGTLIARAPELPLMHPARGRGGVVMARAVLQPPRRKPYVLAALARAADGGNDRPKARAQRMLSEFVPAISAVEVRQARTKTLALGSLSGAGGRSLGRLSDGFVGGLAGEGYGLIPDTVKREGAHRPVRLAQLSDNGRPRLGRMAYWGPAIGGRARLGRHRTYAGGGVKSGAGSADAAVPSGSVSSASDE